jgi:hypothetical protein
MQKQTRKMQKFNVKIKYSKDDPPNKFEGLNRKMVCGAHPIACAPFNKFRAGLLEREA